MRTWHPFLPLLAPVATADLFGSPPPSPAVIAQINAVFALALAAGYVWAARLPDESRGYFCIAKVLAKGLGTSIFVFDHLTGSTPDAILFFSATDGVPVVLTLFVLLQRQPGAGP